MNSATSSATFSFLRRPDSSAIWAKANGCKIPSDSALAEAKANGTEAELAAQLAYSCEGERATFAKGEPFLG